LLGYPPKELKLKATGTYIFAIALRCSYRVWYSVDQQLSTIPIVNGETIILEQVENGGTLSTVDPLQSSTQPTTQSPTQPVVQPSKPKEVPTTVSNSAQPTPTTTVPKAEPPKAAPKTSAAPEAVECTLLSIKIINFFLMITIT